MDENGRKGLDLRVEVLQTSFETKLISTTTPGTLISETQIPILLPYQSFPLYPIVIGKILHKLNVSLWVSYPIEPSYMSCRLNLPSSYVSTTNLDPSKRMTGSWKTNLSL